MKINYLNFYKNYSFIRESQKELIRRYHLDKKMKCPIHFCLGQEGFPALLTDFFKPIDYLFSHHRSHAYYLSKKCSLEKMISEFYGNKFGSNKGLAGSQELSSDENNFFTGTMLSGMFATSIGSAYSQKYLGTKGITATVIGDGGMEEGIVYEALNIASLFSLPILFICENNRYSVHTEMSERTKNLNFKKKINAFNIPYMLVKNQNVNNLYKTVKFIFNQIRKNKTPYFIEIDTFRECGHVGPENDDKEYNYRPNDVKNRGQRDIFKKYFSSLKKKKSINKKLSLIKKKNRNLINRCFSNSINKEPITFQESLNLNFIKSFDKKIKTFTKGKNRLIINQVLTTPKPY